MLAKRAERSEPGPQAWPGSVVGIAGLPDRGNRVDIDSRTREIALLKRVANQDVVAFRELTDMLLAMVVGIARRMLGDDGEAEDVAQEAMIRLWREAGALDAGRNGASAWVRRVVSNLCIDRIRVRKRFDDEDKAPERAEDATQLTGLIERDLSSRVDQALLGLPERQRVALTLFHYEGLSQQEIGTLLGVSEEAVESLLARARRRLRRDLEDDWRQLLGMED